MCLHFPTADVAIRDISMAWPTYRIRTWISDHCIAITGWALAFISMVATIVSLLPGFNGQEISKKALELAQWTALKDYIEQCNDKLVWHLS